MFIGQLLIRKNQKEKMKQGNCHVIITIKSFYANGSANIAYNSYYLKTHFKML